MSVVFRGIEVHVWNDPETDSAKWIYRMRLEEDGIPRTYGIAIRTEFGHSPTDLWTSQALSALLRKYNQISGQQLADALNAGEQIEQVLPGAMHVI